MRLAYPEAMPSGPGVMAIQNRINVHYVVIGLRCLIGVVFLASSVSKVAGRDAFGAFVVSLRTLRPWSLRRARSVAFTLVVAEFMVWLLLAAPTAHAIFAGFIAAAGMLAAFAGGIAVVVRDGVRAPCRCFGASEASLGFQHIVRNLALMVAAGSGAALTVYGSGPTDAGGVVVAMACGLILGGLVATLDHIVELFQPDGDALRRASPGISVNERRFG